MEQLKCILMKLQELSDELDLQFSCDMMLDCAVRILNTNNINHKQTKEEMATDKQKQFLQRLNYVGNVATITKREASKVIDEMINK